jgi:hypothetical protein
MHKHLQDAQTFTRSSTTIATFVQQQCNIFETSVQQQCNICATTNATTVQQ